MNGTETLTGTLHYNNTLVAMGTMRYKDFTTDLGATEKALSKLQINLKQIPDCQGQPKIAQLIGYHLEDNTVKGSWTGEAMLHLVPHINAPVAALPVLKVVDAKHFIADLTLPYGRVLYDYLTECDQKVVKFIA